MEPRFLKSRIFEPFDIDNVDEAHGSVGARIFLSRADRDLLTTHDGRLLPTGDPACSPG